MTTKHRNWWQYGTTALPSPSPLPFKVNRYTRDQCELECQRAMDKALDFMFLRGGRPQGPFAECYEALQRAQELWYQATGVHPGD
jgi:hypothetical protein